MPFTPAHVAAAFPFRRSRLVWSALVVGTIAPDLEYFLRLAPGQPYGHTLPGVFLVTLPLALVTLWLFHALVKAPFIELLPEGLESRLAPYAGKFRFGGAARFALIVASVLIGILTHLVWDSFTHRNTWLVRDWSALRHPVHVNFLGAVPLYKLLQHASTLFGLMVLAVWIAAWYRKAEVTRPSGAQSQSVWPARRILTLIAIAAIAFLAAIIYALKVTGIPSNRGELARFAGTLVVMAIAVMWWELVVLGVVRSNERRVKGLARS
jgi:hypothetical protein